MYLFYFRCQLLNQTEGIDIFLKNLATDLFTVLKHDFIANEQAAFLEKLKNSVGPGEFVVTLDFSENYSFHVQDAVQSQHWSKDQVTLHVYVIYYKENNVKLHASFVVLSEYVNHDATSVHLYNTKMINYLKKKFGQNNVKKLYFFSDGAGSQYKNKFNFINLLNHNKDFGIDFEWHFFATAHGKGACDGIGGCIKRNAYRASLQNNTEVQLTTPKNLYDWARQFFKKIDFELCSNEEYSKHVRDLESRYQKAKTIKGTRQFHCYKPLDINSLECKIFSSSTKSIVIKFKV